ncbi:MAG: hypothetical protein IKI08_07470 [Selenomonadaceae bacterium]|nr:hypothetical protein [Selenomonadaceae bacterium]MBR7025824.1 hypothetical protein [Selenomonadaceae bacterium]
MDEQKKIEPRSFNFLELDEMRGILTKRSLRREKLITEIQWYLKLPKQLHYLAPRIFNYSLYIDKPYIQMEFYGYRTLHEIFLHDELSRSTCEEIFRRLLFIVEDMQACKLQCDKKIAQAAVKTMCVDKTLQRLDKLKGNDDFKNFFTQKIIVNGKSYPSLNEIISLLPDMVARLLFENVEEYFSVIHGDFCLPNILIEEEHKFLRLVDPRGKFGDFDIYGDRRYDLAKLLHSLEGNYDFIIADKFKASVQDTAIDYEFALDFAEVKEIFFKVFEEQLKDLPALRLIEATLFLSMIPLHADSLSRQQVMLARGVELFESVLEEPK